LNLDLQPLWQLFVEAIATHLPSVVAALLIFFVGRIAANLVGKGVRGALTRAKSDAALVGFVTAIARTAILAFVIIAALGQLGVPTSGAVAILGAAGLAVGFALQSSLSNFASGIMLLVFRPFGIGDVIDAGGVIGTVTAIDIFTTTISSPDNRKIIVPNGQITGGTITNVTAYDTRRVDLVAGISYGDNIAKAKEVLERVVRDHPLTLDDPAPMIAVNQLGDSSVNFVVRPWVKTDYYWTVYFELTRSIKEQFDAAGISIPFPQRDVHLFQASGTQN
jgi:small conductance mechanosensitive channel